MNAHFVFSRLCCTQILRITAITLVVLAWSSLAFCGEIDDAARSGDLVKVRALLKENPNSVFSRNTNGATPLHVAVFHGYNEVVELLLANKADVNATNNYGDTPLHVAAGNGHRDLAELLLANKAGVNTRDINGLTALHMAAVNGYKDVAGLLLASGADINAKDTNGVTALVFAAGAGKTDTVEFLLDKGADINTKANNGESALMWATGAGNTDAVKLLLDKGANVNMTNKVGLTALMYAVGADSAAEVKLLLAGGADINMTAPLGVTALGLAREKGDAAIVQLLQQPAAISLSTYPINAVVASGTNTDSQGYVTNATLLTPFTLTNSAGNIVTDAVLVKLTPNTFLYKTPRSEAFQRLDSLSKDLQEKFGYNPSKAAQADELDRQKYAAQLQRANAAAAAAALAEHRSQIESSRMIIEGDVIQKLDVGFLVDSATQIKRIDLEWRASVGLSTSVIGDGRYYDPTTHIQIFNGLCLLTDYPKASSVVDGDVVRAFAYPNGEYSYTAVSGGSKTVRQFTCNINAVLNPPSAAEQNQMRAPKPHGP